MTSNNFSTLHASLKVHPDFRELDALASVQLNQEKSREVGGNQCYYWAFLSTIRDMEIQIMPVSGLAIVRFFSYSVWVWCSRGHFLKFLLLLLLSLPHSELKFKTCHLQTLLTGDRWVVGRLLVDSWSVSMAPCRKLITNPRVAHVGESIHNV